jgi:UDP-N-acetylmuramate dehydrogenase
VICLDWREELKKIIATGEVLCDAPMREHTSFRIGGPVDALAAPGSRAELRRAVDFAAGRGLPWLVLGRGTNLLVRDGGLRGLAIQTDRCLRRITFNDTEIIAEAGVTLWSLANRAATHSLAGLAFAAGIPGTLGGGICMNAGAYGGELSRVVQSVTAYYPGRGLSILDYDELDLGYRASRFQREAALIEEARLKLVPGEEQEIRVEMADYNGRRQAKQPLSLPSAGSVFKRPPGNYAGTLIEAAGLQGTRIGRAQVSTMHANFIVNLGGATAADVLALIELVRATVYEKSGIALEPEIKVVGED